MYSMDPDEFCVIFERTYVASWLLLRSATERWHSETSELPVSHARKRWKKVLSAASEVKKEHAESLKLQPRA
jgi:hypothetical protein